MVWRGIARRAVVRRRRRDDLHAGQPFLPLQRILRRHRHNSSVTPSPDLKSDPAFLTNFLGVKIATRYFPGILDGKEGEVEPIPIPANWHADIAEWAFALRAVDMAKRAFRAVELGCGWGCWLNNTGAAARRRGLAVDLIGIEGDEGMSALRWKALSPTVFRVTNSVSSMASPRRGDRRRCFRWSLILARSGARRPYLMLPKPRSARPVAPGGHQVLDAWPLADLSGGKPIDLLAHRHSRRRDRFRESEFRRHRPPRATHANRYPFAHH